MSGKIAVVGMSCLFPGARNPSELWQNLIAERDSKSWAGIEELGLDPGCVYAPVKGTPDRCYSLRGAYVHGFALDPRGFAVPPELLTGLDPLAQATLHVSREGLRDSGCLGRPEALSRCGLILGNLSFPTRSSRALLGRLYQRPVTAAMRELIGRDDFELGAAPPAEPCAATVFGSVTGLVAQALGLAGPHFSLDAACSSALWAVQLAGDYLAAGAADLMLAAAVSWADPLFVTMLFSGLQAHPDDDVSRPLDRSSRGIVPAEGAGVLVLKRYDDAVRAGDRIHAVLLGAGSSNDGRGRHLLSPNPKGQVLAFERAYAAAGVDPATIDYVECHATGTPLGDLTELQAMAAFFGRHGAAPWVGSVKSNLGHLLTAAGMAGLLKLILSLQARLIPATIEISAPLGSAGGATSSSRVLRAATPWPQRGAERRGAVSAFGFGGTNAHLVLAEAPAGSEPPPAPDVQPASGHAVRLAIVGMDACFGPCVSLDDLAASIFAGSRHFEPPPEERWRAFERAGDLLAEHGLGDRTPPPGAYVRDFELDLEDAGIPPNQVEEISRQQLLAMRVAGRALGDAGFRPQRGGPANVAVIFAMSPELAAHRVLSRYLLPWQLRQELSRAGLDLPEDRFLELAELLRESWCDTPSVAGYLSSIGSIMASRISSRWDLTGPAFTLSAQESSTFRAIEAAQLLLISGRATAVLVGAVDLAGEPEDILMRLRAAPAQRGPVSLSFDRAMRGWAVGEGAGAVVLKTLAAARQDGDRIYAVVDAVSLIQDDAAGAPGAGLASPSGRTVARACRRAFDLAAIAPTAVGLLEACGSGLEHQDEAEIAGLLEAYEQRQESERGPACALGSVKANVGHAQASSGMASLIKAALCLHHRHVPPTPGWSGSKHPRQWQGSPFYVAAELRPWLVEAGEKRTAAVNGMGSEGTAAHLILSEAAGTRPAGYGGWPQAGQLCLLPIGAVEPGRLLDRLRALRQEATGAPCLDTLARRCLADKEGESHGARRLAVLVAGNREELLRQIDLALTGIPDALARGGEWQTPLGSYFTASPLGARAKIAFVYPGAFNSYLGVGRDLFRIFPALYDRCGSITRDMPRRLREDLIYPRSFEPLSSDQLRQAERRLFCDPAGMLESGTALAFLHTTVALELFGLRPQAAFGYSLGEASMLFGLGVWGDGDESFGRLRRDGLFESRLGGRRDAVAEHWRRRPLDGAAADASDWSSLVLKASPARVEAALAGHQRAYLTHVNTPGEVVIAGDRRAILQLADAMHCHRVEVPIQPVLHCEPAWSVYAELRQLHRLPLRDVPRVTFYCAASDEALPMDSDVIARHIATGLCQRLDFARLIERVYADGARVFVELGPGRTCCRWIDETLGERAHLAVSFSRKGVEDRTTLLRAAARLASHGMPVDLSWLSAPAPAPARGALTRRIEIAGRGPTGAPSAAEAAARFRGERLPAPEAQAAPPPAGTGPVSEAPRATTVFEQADLLEFAGGDLARVFGPDYGIIDSYRRRVRLPLPPYLLVTRVTALEAERGRYEPSSIQTEYEVPRDAWYLTGGRIPWAVALEGCQCDMLLVSMIGVDFENRGERVYRLLDWTPTFLGELPRAGETLRYDIRIERFTRSGENLLFFFSYDCSAGGRPVLRMRGGCAGFFDDAELDAAKGVVATSREVAERRAVRKRPFTPVLACSRRCFSSADLASLDAGDFAACFGAAHGREGPYHHLRLASPGMEMIERVLSVDPRGGAWGLGEVTAEKSLDPNAWYFTSHFKDDSALPGSLMADACAQLLKFYLLYLGLHTLGGRRCFQPVAGLPQAIRYRAQVPQSADRLTYRLEVTSIGLAPEPFATADVDILFRGKVVTRYRSLGMRLADARHEGER
jgi:PfaB family protein